MIPSWIRNGQLLPTTMLRHTQKILNSSKGTEYDSPDDITAKLFYDNKDEDAS